MKVNVGEQIMQTCVVSSFLKHLKRHCIEFKYYADGIHSGLTPPGNNS